MCHSTVNRRQIRTPATSVAGGTSKRGASVSGFFQCAHIWHCSQGRTVSLIAGCPGHAVITAQPLVSLRMGSTPSGQRAMRTWRRRPGPLLST